MSRAGNDIPVLIETIDEDITEEDENTGLSNEAPKVGNGISLFGSTCEETVVADDIGTHDEVVITSGIDLAHEA